METIWYSLNGQRTVREEIPHLYYDVMEIVRVVISTYINRNGLMTTVNSKQNTCHRVSLYLFVYYEKRIFLLLEPMFAR